MNTQNDERKVIPIESHPWWGKKHDIRLPKQTRAPHQRRASIGMVYSPNPEPPSAA